MPSLRRTAASVLTTAALVTGLATAGAGTAAADPVVVQQGYFTGFGQGYTADFALFSAQNQARGQSINAGFGGADSVCIVTNQSASPPFTPNGFWSATVGLSCNRYA